MQTTTASSGEPVTLHGFTVYPYGPLSAEFRRALNRSVAAARRPLLLRSRLPGGQDGSGKLSGITHAGGRYLDPANHLTPELLDLMRAMGTPLPAPPCLVASGPKVLFHEWGHRVDRRWTPEDQGVNFSFSWFSHLYRISAAPSMDFHGCRTRNRTTPPSF